jgi:hypothetical protein
VIIAVAAEALWKKQEVISCFVPVFNSYGSGETDGPPGTVFYTMLSND